MIFWSAGLGHLLAKVCSKIFLKLKNPFAFWPIFSLTLTPVFGPI